MIRAVIFDIDGTLLNSVDFHAEAWQRVLAEYGHRLPFHVIRKQIGKGGDQLLPVFLSPAEIAQKGEEITKKRGELFKSEYLAKVHPFPMVRQLFERARGAGKMIALASSGTESEVRKYQEIAQISDLIDTATSADDVEKSKPHPDVIHAALTKLGGLTPDRVVLVGDTPYDAQAAGKAGVRTIGVLCGGFTEADLRQAGCVAIYRDPADLLAHFDSSILAD